MSLPKLPDEMAEYLVAHLDIEFVPSQACLRPMFEILHDHETPECTIHLDEWWHKTFGIDYINCGYAFDQYNYRKGRRK